MLAAATHPGLLRDAESLLEPPPEAAAFEMAIGLVGEVHHLQIAEVADTRAVVAALHHKTPGFAAVAELNPAHIALHERIQGVLHQLLD